MSTKVKLKFVFSTKGPVFLVDVEVVPFVEVIGNIDIRVQIVEFPIFPVIKLQLPLHRDDHFYGHRRFPRQGLCLDQIQGKGGGAPGFGDGVDDGKAGDGEIDVVDGEDAIAEGDQNGILWHGRKLRDGFLAEVFVRSQELNFGLLIGSKKKNFRILVLRLFLLVFNLNFQFL